MVKLIPPARASCEAPGPTTRETAPVVASRSCTCALAAARARSAPSSARDPGRRAPPAILAVLALWGCGKAEPPPVPTVRASALDPDTVSDVDVTGVISGERFTLREAWFRRQTRAGRERVDIILSAGELGKRCRDADVTNARHVWLRFDGVADVAPGTYRGDVDSEDTLSAHYEAHEEEGWTGRGGTAAVTIEPPPSPTPAGGPTEGDVIGGKVHACFGPGAEGCVSGAFRAHRCFTEAELEGPYSNKQMPPGEAAPEVRQEKLP